MSKRARMLITFIVSILTGALLLMCAMVLISNMRLVYATPERRSTFLNDYSPESVIKPFTSTRWISDLGTGEGAAAGDGAANYTKMFEARFAMRSGDTQVLSAALAEGIIDELQKSGGRLVEQTRDDAGGFHFKYAEGRSAGTLTLTPVRRLDPDHLGGPNGVGPKKESLLFLQADEIPVEFSVSVEETWKR